MDADTMPLLAIHGAALHAMAEGEPGEAANITVILARRLREQEAERERDRRQIARLTERTEQALALLREHSASLDPESFISEIVAVLADEEDAPIVDGYATLDGAAGGGDT